MSYLKVISTEPGILNADSRAPPGLGAIFVRQQFRTQRAPAGRLISHENDQHVLEEIVVERAASLRYEERQEAPLAQESELIGFAHQADRPWWVGAWDRFERSRL